MEVRPFIQWMAHFACWMNQCIDIYITMWLELEFPPPMFMVVVERVEEMEFEVEVDWGLWVDWDEAADEVEVDDC